MYEQRFSDNDVSKRDVPSFIEPRPPLISNPFMRPKPQKGTNLLELFEEDSECEEPELVQVHLRLKPCVTPSNLYEVRSERCLITSLDTTTAGHGRRTQHNVSKMYTFSHIFGPEANQKEIFEHVVKDNLRKLPDGHNFTLLTYGASGSGKTYTLMGTVASPGLVPRSLEYVFRVVEAAQQPLYKPAEGGADKLNYAEQDYELQWVKRLRHVSAPLREKYRRMSARLCSDMTTSTFDLSNRTRYYVWVSFVEIYNEGIYDLLAPGDRRNASKLLIREDSNGTVYVKGATQAFVRTGEEAYDVMVAGKHNLQVAATGVHAQSSRSHCIFTITMLTHTDEGVRVSCVRLCDLAGCERARRTRNTGARMQESRAINSSLHVLERCLHTLRRKQRATKTALVPYRESKLTRLLGAGLSGARGEAVSMVVTLNPAPEYAHETRHVLQLAAVAKDIQINNTISEYASTLETSQDTTLGGADVLKLRAENERLHFELVQSQARNRQLCASMEERQAAAADMMREVVEEAKQITRQYYETQLEALRTEMEEMAEEYESRLNNVVLPPTVETPSRSLQNKITDLMTEIAILEEKLNAERLARARAEEEVQHLRACIEERDENAAGSNEEVMSLTDSDNDNSDAEDDPCNESLEPTFKKEDINRSRLIRQSLLEQPSVHNDSIESSEKSEDSVLETSTDTIKDNDKTNSLDDSYATGNESDLKKVDQTGCVGKRLTQTESLDKSTDEVSLITDIKDNVEKDKINYFDDRMEIGTDLLKNSTVDSKKTYFDDEIEGKSNLLKNDTSFKSICRGTYFVSEPKVHNLSAEKVDVIPIDDNEARKTMDIKNNSNALYETIPQDSDLPESVDNNDTKQSINTQESVDVMQDCNAGIVSEENEALDAVDEWEIPRKASETLVSKIISSLKSTTSSNSSLAQFEQLEKETRDCKSVGRENTPDEFCNIKILKEKRNYFDDIKEKREENPKSLERKTYFDNISVNLNKVSDKRLTELRSDSKNDDDVRSPSIVKEDVTNDFEPSTIKKLLGESMTRHPDVTSSSHQVTDQVKRILNKKCDSIDVFDSPQIHAVEPTHEKIIEKLNESIEKIALDNNKSKHVKLPAIKIEQPSLEKKDFDIADQNKTNRSFANNSPLKDENLTTTIKQEDTVPTNINQSNASSSKSDNTIEEFENLYKDITAPRATDFELLVSQEITEAQNNAIVPELPDTSTQDKTKYNLRHKSLKLDKSKTNEEEGTKAKTTKRNLRLRRRRNMTDEERNELEEMERDEKLKDIVNLQSEFSDVTIDVPAKVKEVRDIPSPEKVEMEENVPPMMGIQSCPSKSVTRSRRKLFTPRVEPFDESLQGNSGERVCVPRPSYQRPRARRKL